MRSFIDNACFWLSGDYSGIQACATLPSDQGQKEHTAYSISPKMPSAGNAQQRI